MGSIRLFVYGSLRPGQQSWGVIADHIESWLSGTVSGLGLWHLPEGYPAVSPTARGHVVGELLLGREGSPLLRSADAFERYDPSHPSSPQNLYVRRRVSVQTVEHGLLEAWTYAYHPSRADYLKHHGVPVPTGDWCDFLASREVTDED